MDSVYWISAGIVVCLFVVILLLIRIDKKMNRVLYITYSNNTMFYVAYENRLDDFLRDMNYNGRFSRR